AQAAEPEYGKVETFEPGKKYNCVPTPDHKGWDCQETGKDAGKRPAAQKKPEAETPVAHSSPPAAPQASPTAESRLVAESTAPPASTHVAEHAVPAPPEPAPAAPRGAALPSYLRAPGSRSGNDEPPSSPPSAAAAEAPPAPEPAAAAPAPERAAEPMAP